MSFVSRDRVLSRIIRPLVYVRISTRQPEENFRMENFSCHVRDRVFSRVGRILLETSLRFCIRYKVYIHIIDTDIEDLKKKYTDGK